MRRLIYLIISLFYINMMKSSPVSTQFPPSSVGLEEESDVNVQNKTTSINNMEDLLNHQTENINKIISDQREAEYPVVTKLEPQYSETIKETDKLTFEELKTKCQHISHLLNISNKQPSNKPDIHRYPNSQIRPVYIQPQPTFRPRHPSTYKPSSFYITQTSSTTHKPTINVQTATPIKYIRLEPVILQKTILGDGRIVYYWHRSLPTAVEYPNGYSEDVPSINVSVNEKNEFASSIPPNSYAHVSQSSYPPIGQNGYVSTAQSGYVPLPQKNYVPNSQSYYATRPQYGYTYPVPNGYNFSPTNGYFYSSSSNTYYPTNQNTYVNQPAENEPVESTTSTPTSTTEGNTYSGYGFSNFIPFYNYGQDYTTTTTTTAEPISTSTIPKPITEKLVTDDLLYAQQLKFVIPVPYEGTLGAGPTPLRQPWNYNQYAYYPKEMHPNGANVRVPYSPTYHMIRAVSIPKIEGNSKEGIDDVNVK